MPQSGRVAFGNMEAVAFGRPAAAEIAAEAQRCGAKRVFLMVSGTLNRTTGEIDKLRRALGNRFAGLFDRMPPHTPRHAVIEAAAMAREAAADLIATLGGGSVTDGAKAVQLCLANDIRTPEALDDYRPVKGPDGAFGPPPACKAPSVRQITAPTTLSAGEFSAISGITDERRRVKEELWWKLGDGRGVKAAYRGGCRACQNLSRRAIRHEGIYHIGRRSGGNRRSGLAGGGSELRALLSDGRHRHLGHHDGGGCGAAVRPAVWPHRGQGGAPLEDQGQARLPWRQDRDRTAPRARP